MISKTDWQTANERLMAEDRLRLGEPPTTEEMLAYTRGELSPDEEERMRERLVAHPDLLRALAVPFPGEGAEPGDPDYVSDDEWPAHWAALQRRMRPGRVVAFRRHGWTALAAALALVFAGLYWQAEWKSRRPQVVAWEEALQPDTPRRGPMGPATTLAAEGDSLGLVLDVHDRAEWDTYRVAIVEAGEPRALWSSGAVRARADQRVAIVVPRSFLGPGQYQIILYGIDESGEESLATYTVRVPAS